MFVLFTASRTLPNLDDLAMAFREAHIDLGEIKDFITHVEPVSFAHETVQFPAKKPDYFLSQDYRDFKLDDSLTYTEAEGSC